LVICLTAADAEHIVKDTNRSTSVETARYIGGMARELRGIAVKSDLGFLAYLLSMVEQEADTAANGKPSSAGRKPAG
jgi:hypothetical protein